MSIGVTENNFWHSRYQSVLDEGSKETQCSWWMPTHNPILPLHSTLEFTKTLKYVVSLILHN